MECNCEHLIHSFIFCSNISCIYPLSFNSSIHPSINHSIIYSIQSIHPSIHQSFNHLFHSIHPSISPSKAMTLFTPHTNILLGWDGYTIDLTLGKTTTTLQLHYNYTTLQLHYTIMIMIMIMMTQELVQPHK
jgi:hypothetical protein